MIHVLWRADTCWLAPTSTASSPSPPSPTSPLPPLLSFFCPPSPICAITSDGPHSNVQLSQLIQGWGVCTAKNPASLTKQNLSETFPDILWANVSEKFKIERGLKKQGHLLLLFGQFFSLEPSQTCQEANLPCPQIVLLHLWSDVESLIMLIQNCLLSLVREANGFLKQMKFSRITSENYFDLSPKNCEFGTGLSEHIMVA